MQESDVIKARRRSSFFVCMLHISKMEIIRGPRLIHIPADILYTFKEGLASEGYNVEAFVDPTEAFTHFVNVNPSRYKMAILDIRMPSLNGLQLYYKLKAINRNIKILFVSALDAVPELISLMLRPQMIL